MIMLLVTLVEMEERHRAISMTTTTMSGSSSSGSYVSKKNDIQQQQQQQQQQGLYLPNFLLAYKLIIGGMQWIKSINSDTSYFISKVEEEESRQQAKLALCNRLKERTLGNVQ